MESILLKLQQLGRLSLDWIKIHPNSMFAFIGVLLLISGQVQIFSSKILLGAQLSILGGLIIIIPWLAGAQLIKLFNLFAAVIQKLIETSKTKNEIPKEPTAEGEQSIEITPEPYQGEALRVIDEPMTPLPPVVSAWQKKLEAHLSISKKQMIILGIAFFVISQPLLMMEKYLLAMLFILPSVVLLGKSLFLKKDYVWSIEIKTLLLNGGLLIPGLAMIIAGNIILLNIIKLGNSWEAAGLGLNGLGIFLLYFLFPRKLEDPEPTIGNVLECHDGHARTAKGVALKILFVILAVSLFFILRINAGQLPINYQIILVFAMLGFLFLSFPWKFQAKEKPDEDHYNKNILFKLIRLAAFVGALYLGYRGQQLIGHEQLYPGLYRYFWAGLALLVAFKEPSMGRSVDPSPDKSLKWYWEFLVLVMIMAVGTWIRFHMLDSIPYGVECDEAGSGWAAMQALYEKLPSLITAKEGGRPLFMLMPKVISFKLFGVNSFSLKFMSAIWGVLGVTALYFMARHMFGIKAAMGAAALLSLSRIQIHFSRYGWSNTLMILILTMGFYFLIKGLEQRKKIYFFLSGILMSFCVQTETAARLVPLICGGLLIYLWLTQRQFIRRNWKPVMVMMLGVWLAGAGIFAFWIQKPETFFVI